MEKHIMTINDVLTQYEYFEYSREYLDLLKESYEIQFMEKYLEAQTFADDFSTYYSENTTTSLSGYILETTSNQTTTKSTSDKLNEKKEGFIRKILNLFKKMIDTLVTFFKRIIAKFRKKDTDDIEDDLSKVSDEIAKEFTEKATEKTANGLDELIDKYINAIKSSFSSVFHNNEVPNEQLLLEMQKELTKKGKIKRLEIPKTNLNAFVVQQKHSNHPIVQFAARNGLDLTSAYRVFKASYMLTLLKKYENAVDLSTLGDMFRSIMEYARRNTWKNAGETPEERARIRSSQYDKVISTGFDRFKKYRPAIQVLVILGSFPADSQDDYSLERAFKQYTDYSSKLKEAIIQKDNNRTDLSGLHDMSIVIKMQNIVGDTIRLISEYLSHIGQSDSKMSQYIKTNILVRSR